MWTDLAANTMVGTRGVHQPRYQPLTTHDKRNLGDQLSSSDLASLPSGHYPVYHLERRIRYRWAFGIPAFICCAVIAGVCLLALITMICGRGTIKRLRWYLFHSTSGRVLATHMFPDTAHYKSAETKVWLNQVGRKSVTVTSSTGCSTGFEGEQLHIMSKGTPNYVEVRQKEDTESISSGWDAPLTHPR